MSYYDDVDRSLEEDMKKLQEKAKKIETARSLPDSYQAIKEFRAFLLLLHLKYKVAEEETAP